MANFSFSRHERLRSKKLIAELFNSGNHVFNYPYKLVYKFIEEENPTVPVQMAVTVPKRRFKSAVKRNLIKRRTKEAYRKAKPEVYASLNQIKGWYAAILVYVAPEIELSQVIEPSIQKILKKFVHAIKEK